MNSLVREFRSASEIDSGDFRFAMRQLAGGVAIVTAGRDREISGMTVTSLTSLSAEPPRLIVCVNRAASVYPLIERSGAFGVSLLAADQRHVAVRFSDKTIKGPKRFQGLQWRTLVTGSPLLLNASAEIDCQVEETIERHSHAIVVGRVLDISFGSHAGGLVYHHGDYVSIGADISHTTDARGLWW